MDLRDLGMVEASGLSGLRRRMVESLLAKWEARTWQCCQDRQIGGHVAYRPGL